MSVQLHSPAHPSASDRIAASQQLSIEAGRKIIQRHLARLTVTTGILASETFLLDADRLVGIRFSLKQYTAEWRLGTAEIVIRSAGEVTDRIAMPPSHDRSAESGQAAA